PLHTVSTLFPYTTLFRSGAAGAQAVDVGAVLRRRDQVDVAFLHQFALGHPGDRPVDDLGVLLQLPGEQLRRQQFGTGELALEVVAQSVLVVPAHALAAGLVEQRHRQARAEHGLGAQQVAQRTQVELRAVEILRVRPAAQARAGIALADAAHDLKPARRFAAGEVHAVLLAVADRKSVV